MVRRGVSVVLLLLVAMLVLQAGAAAQADFGALPRKLLRVGAGTGTSSGLSRPVFGRPGCNRSVASGGSCGTPGGTATVVSSASSTSTGAGSGGATRVSAFLAFGRRP